MMSQLREDLLNAIGTTYQQLSSAMAVGEEQHARRALGRLRQLKERLVAAREEEQQRYVHVGCSGRSCLVSRDEDGLSALVQAWRGTEECEVTRFRTMEAAHHSLTHSGDVAMSSV